MARAWSICRPPARPRRPSSAKCNGTTSARRFSTPISPEFPRTSRIRVAVPVELRGIAPGVAAGGVLDQPIHSLNIECLAIAVPESIRVNVAELQIGMAIHIKEVHLPPDTKALGDPDAIVVQVSAPVDAVETPAGPAAEQAEPELIGRKVAEEEEEEAK